MDSVANLSPAPSPLVGWLSEPARERGIRFAAGEDWEWWPWARLGELARRMATGLLAAGARPQARVAIVEPASPAFVATLFGAMLAGAVPSPLPPPLPFHDPERYGDQIGHMMPAAAPEYLVVGSPLQATVEPLARAVGARVLGLEGLLASAPGEFTGLPGPGELALLQFTSGTSGRARPVRIPAAALEANTAAIQRWLAMTEDDATASWLPVHHDMGLIGCLLTPAIRGSDLWLMRPEQFIRSPLSYLRCFGGLGARLTAMPSFGLEHVIRRVAPAGLDGMDFSQWRAIIVGAERISADTLSRFADLLAPAGLLPTALLPAYGLAEATLAVTGLPLPERWRAAAIDSAATAMGAPVRASANGAPVRAAENGAPGRAGGSRGRASEVVIGCGRPLAGVTVTIEDESGARLRDGTLGEIVVRGASVSSGYGSAGPTETVIANRAVRTGDAGFIRDGELYVLGRLGDALKVRGRAVFAEDIEAALCAGGIPSRRVAALLGHHRGAPTAVALLEDPRDGWHALATKVLRFRAEEATTVVLNVPRGTIARTTSGKPKRRALWMEFAEGRLSESAHAPRNIENAEQEEGVRV